MTASEELSLRYYEVCCLLLQRWKYSNQNNREDMNEASARSGASYDELRSILKHLRAKYMLGFNNAQKQGRYVGDFFGYYTSTKRPRGRPPTAGGEGGVARAAASVPRVQQQQSARFVTGAGDLAHELEGSESGSARSSPAGAVERRGGCMPSAPRLPSSRPRKAVAPYEPPVASTHSRSSSTSSVITAAGRGRKGAGSKAQPVVKRSRGGVAAAAAAFSTAGRQQDMQVWEGQEAGSFRYESSHQESWYGNGGKEGEDTDEEYDEDAVVVMMMDDSSSSSKQREGSGAADSLFHLVEAAEKASGKKKCHKKGAGLVGKTAAVAVARAVSPVEDDLGMLLLGLKARPAPFLRRESSLSLAPAAAVVEPIEAHVSAGSSSNSVNELSPSSNPLQSSLDATTLDGGASMCSLSTHTSSSGSNSNGSFYTGHPHGAPPGHQSMPSRLSYPPMAYHAHAPPPPPPHHPHYYHPQHYYPHLYNQQQQQQQLQSQHPYHVHHHHQQQQQLYQQQYYPQQAYQHNTSTQADLLHASYPSTVGNFPVPAMPGPAGGAVAGAEIPALAAGAIGAKEQKQQQHAGSDRAAADLFVNMMNGIGGPTTSSSSSSSSASSGAAVRTNTVATTTC